MRGKRIKKRLAAILITFVMISTDIIPAFAAQPGVCDVISENEVVVDEEESEGQGVSNGKASDKEKNDNEIDMVSDNEIMEISDDNEEEKAGGNCGHEEATGYIAVPMDVPDTYYPEGAEEPAGGIESTYLPDTATELTSVKDQGQEGLCWAYSAAAVLEKASMISNIDDINADYSERQLENAFIGTHRSDPLNLTEGDGVWKEPGGNNNIFTTWLLASQAAPVDQESPETSGFDDRTVSLVEARFIPSNDITAIKQAIKDYGSVTLGIDSTNYNGGGSNSLTYGYRAASHYSEGHAVSLVGWDDTIERTRFGDKDGKSGNYYAAPRYDTCPSDGGFLFKNSWGTDIGLNGYQYIAYSDNAFSGNSKYVIAYRTASEDSFDYIYEYDGSYGTGTSTVTRAANIYTASSNPSSNGRETINRAGFGVSDVGEYNVSVYENPSGTEALTNATTGQWFMNDVNRIASKDITVQNAGYYTVDFEDAPDVTEGTEFAVVLTKKNGDSFMMYVDKTYDNTDSGGNTWIRFTANTANEKTFAQNGNSCLNTSSFTPRLKVFTKKSSASGQVETVDLSTGNVRLNITSTVYTGAGIEPKVTVKDANGSKILMEGNYTVSYLDNTDVGTGKAIISAVSGGKCVGSRIVTFSILPRDLAEVDTFLIKNDGSRIKYNIQNSIWGRSALYTYDLLSRNFEFIYSGKALKKGTDYTVLDPNTPLTATSSETADKIYFKGMGNYTGTTYTNAYVYSKYDLQYDYQVSFGDGTSVESRIIMDEGADQYVYTGELPVITDLKLVNTTRGRLTPGVDYTVTNTNTTKKNAGNSFRVTAEGIGNYYEGSKNFEINIIAANLSDAEVTGISDKQYTGSAVTQDGIVVSLNGRTLLNGTDYKLSYQNNTDAGTASVIITGIGNYAGSINRTFTISKKSISDTILSGFVDSLEYTGTALRQSITLKDGTKTLTENTDYTLEYSDNVNVGTAALRITGKGGYTGYIDKTYLITKATPVITSLSARAITYKQSLGSSSITGTAKVGNTVVSGRFSFDHPDIVPAYSDSNSTEYDVTFTPEKSQNINSVKGKIKIFVNKADPVLQNPVIPVLTYSTGRTLGDIIIENPAENTEGTWEWTSRSTLIQVPGGTYNAKFTPADPGYSTKEVFLSVTVKKAVPEISNLSASSITYGQILSNSNISGTAKFEDRTVAGTFSFDTPSVRPGPADSNSTLYAITFVPQDDVSFESVPATVKVEVNQAEPRISMPVISDRTYRKGLSLSDLSLSVSDGDTPGSLTWSEPGTLLTVPGGAYEAVFTPTDAGYKTKTVSINICVKKADVILSDLTATQIREGHRLNVSTVSGVANNSSYSSESVEGSFAFADPSIIPETSDSEKTEYDVIFTPDDDVNYNTATGKVKLVINSAYDGITVPTIAPVVYKKDMKLSDITITKAAGDIEGSWTWVSPETALNVPGGNYRAKFTPSDAARDPVTVSISVTVSKAEVNVTGLSAGRITYGQSYSSSTLSEGLAKDNSGNVVAGTFTFEEPDTVPSYSESGSTAYVIFSPSSGNYKESRIQVSVGIDKAVPAIGSPSVSAVIYYPGIKLGDIEIDDTETDISGTWMWQVPQTQLHASNASYTAAFVPANPGYENVEKDITVTVRKADPNTEIPLISERTYISGMKLADIDLSSFSSETSGVWSWDVPETALKVPGGKYKATFKPENKLDYNNKTADISIRINKASVVLSDVHADPIYYGMSLKEAAVHGNAKSNYLDVVSGNFAFENGNTVPLVSESNRKLFNVKFTPSEPENYEAASAEITIEVLKSVPVISDTDRSRIKNLTIISGNSLSSVTANLPAFFKWADDVDTETVYNTVGETIHAEVIYNPDSNNYQDASDIAIITVTGPSVSPDPAPAPGPDPVNPPGPEITEPDPEPEPETEEPPEKDAFEGKIKSLSIIDENRKKVKSVKMAKGSTVNLGALIVMSAGEEPDAHFRSTNTKVVKVTDNGKVTGFGQGTAAVTLYCGNKTAKCTVTVTEELADVMLSKQKDKLAVGEKMVIGADVYPLTSASDRTVSWSVDNKKLASVAGGCAGCVFTAKKAGNVTVTAKIKTKDAAGKSVVLVKTCPVRIEAAKLDPLSTADKSYKLKFRKPNVKINGYGNTATVTAVLSNASKSGSVSVDWLSSNEDVIKILESESIAYPEGTKALASATVSACGIGYAYVYARVTDNETGLVNVNRCKITVNAPVEKIGITGDSLGLLNQDTMEIRKGQKDVLFVDVIPESPTNINKIKWSAKGGVTVKNGVIYANKVMSGVSKVTVTCGGKKHTIFINVTK